MALETGYYRISNFQFKYLAGLENDNEESSLVSGVTHSAHAEMSFDVG